MTRDLSPWDDRPVLSASMLNPALVAAAINWATKRYEAKANRPMPLELIFLIVPACLHMATRNALPTTTRTHMPTWVNDHQELIAGFPHRASKFAPHVREGLRLGLRTGMLALDNDGGLTSKTRTPTLDSGEVKEILTAAALFGAWSAKTGSSTTIYTLFGVTP